MKLEKGAGPFFADAVAAVVLGIAVVAAWTGGWRLEALGVTLSARSAWRPAAMAVVLVAARWSARRDTPRLAEISESLARVVAGALLVAGVLAWATHLSPYIGGADSYGYVSAAERISHGQLIRAEPLAAILPYPNALDVATPLGYVPSGRVSGASVPAYPLGLPTLMAAASLVSARGALYVSFVMAIALVSLCGWLVYRTTGDQARALATAAAISFHPVVFAYAIQPMSDVPAAACYFAAMLLVGRVGQVGRVVNFLSRPIGTGIAGGMAFLIRPALLPAVAALGLAARVPNEPRWRPAIVFGGVLALFVAVQLWVQWYLYGSPLASGYGSAGELFSFNNVLANVRSYAYWGAAMHGVVWIGGLVAALFVVRSRTILLLLAAPVFGAVVPHLFYRTYDHWETQRFILPLLVMCTVAVVGALFELARRWLPRAGAWAALVLVAVMVVGWARWLEREQVLQLAFSEQRFSQAGQLVARVAPSNAVVLASLHSGSVRYYAHRETLDWAKIPMGSFEATVTALRQHELPVFVMLDGDEERAAFVARHGDVLERQRWLPSGQRRNVRLYQAPSR